MTDLDGDRSRPVTRCPTHTPDPVDVELVARALARRFCRDGRDALVFLDAVAPGGAEPERADARAVLTALAGAGRLLPPDADTRTEWAVKDPKREGVYRFQRQEAAERAVADDPADLIVMRRTIWVGPWVPIPTTPTCEHCNDTGVDETNHGPDVPVEVHPCGYCGGASVPTTPETP